MGARTKFAVGVGAAPHYHTNVQFEIKPMADTQSLLRDNVYTDEPRPPPNHDQTSTSSTGLGYPTGRSPRINDIVWVAVFCISNAFILVLALFNIGKGSVCHGNTIFNICDLSFITFASVLLSVVSSLIFGFVCVKLMTRPDLSSNVIGFSFSINIVLWSLIGLTASAKGSWFLALTTLFLGGAYGLFYVIFKHKLDFTYALLEYTTECLKQSNLLETSVLKAQAALLFYELVWLLALCGVTSPVLFMLVLLSKIWTVSVVITLVYIAGSGAMASWYFDGNPQPAPQGREVVVPVKANLGSICFGSLLVALSQTLRTLANGSFHSGAPGSCLALCIFGVSEYIVNFVSRSAFSYVAIWGMDFCSAVECTSSLLRTRALDVFSNNNFTSTIVLAAASIGGMIAVFVSYVPCVLLGENSHLYGVGTASYVVGFSTTFVAMTTVESMTNSFLILWIEAPDILASKSRFQRLVSAASQYHRFPNPAAAV